MFPWKIFVRSHKVGDIQQRHDRWRAWILFLLFSTRCHFRIVNLQKGYMNNSNRLMYAEHGDFLDRFLTRVHLMRSRDEWKHARTSNEKLSWKTSTIIFLGNQETLLKVYYFVYNHLKRFLIFQYCWMVRIWSKRNEIQWLKTRTRSFGCCVKTTLHNKSIWRMN